MDYERKTIEQIKAEIERLQERYPMAASVLRRLEIFINSLQAETVSEDLEEEITRYFSKNPIKHLTDWPALKNTALHFANWQKEQMLKDAVKSKVLENDADNGDSALVYIDGKQLYVGQRVKLIIVKED